MGYFGNNCGVPCVYPAFGQFCMETCNCGQSECNHVYGCKRDGKTILMFIFHLLRFLLFGFLLFFLLFFLFLWVEGGAFQISETIEYYVIKNELTGFLTYSAVYF